MRLIIVLIVAIALAGCSASRERSLVIDGVGGGLILRDMGSNNQHYGEGFSGNADVNMPINGFQSPIKLDLSGRGLLSYSTIEIRNIYGTVLIQRAGSGNQNMSVAEILEKIAIPGPVDWFTEISETRIEIPIMESEGQNYGTEHNE